jgi:hypothetical protein
MQVVKSLQLMHGKAQDWHSVVLLDEKYPESNNI